MLVLHLSLLASLAECYLLFCSFVSTLNLFGLTHAEKVMLVKCCGLLTYSSNFPSRLEQGEEEGDLSDWVTSKQCGMRWSVSEFAHLGTTLETFRIALCGTTRQLGANIELPIANIIKLFMRSVPSSINMDLLIMNWARGVEFHWVLRTPLLINHLGIMKGK